VYAPLLREASHLSMQVLQAISDAPTLDDGQQAATTQAQAGEAAQALAERAQAMAEQARKVLEGRWRESHPAAHRPRQRRRRQAETRQAQV